MKKYRVIQWATGAMGKTCLRALLDCPSVELVGLYVYGQAKEGQDAGDIARRPPTGVKATRDVEEILALEADVVIHCARLAPPYGSHDAELIRLLASGKNVISINGYSQPHSLSPDRRAALEAACRSGGSTLMGAGLNPGFAAEQLAMVATSICSRLDHVEIVESVPCQMVRSPDYVFGVLGFGSDPATVDPNNGTWGPASALNGMYADALAAAASHLGLVLDRVETDHRVFPATRDLEIGAGLLKQGGISHVNWRWRGIVGDKPLLTISIHWYMETAHLDNPQPPLWQIQIEGEPGVRIAVDLSKHASDTTRVSAEQIAVAGSVINAIPIVCAAAPGLLTRPLATPHQVSR